MFVKEPAKLRAETDTKAAPRAINTPARSWVVPISTVAALAAAFCIYYFVYVGAKREYLVNRNFRSLAALGDQLQRIVSTHASILEFYARLAQEKTGADRTALKLSKFLMVRAEDKLLDPTALDLESKKDYVHYLAPALDLIEEGAPSKTLRPLEVQRHNGRWQILLSVRPPGTERPYLGSLEIAELLKVETKSLPFDDILLMADDGTVVYQDKKAGPQFTTLASLLKARVEPAGKTGGAEQPSEAGHVDATEKKRAGPGESATVEKPEYAWRGGAVHLTDVLLAGTHYKLFLQPILIDLGGDATQTGKEREWAICGLRSSKALEWEALSISYTAVIGFTALFFAICMGGPVLKVIFINHRERFRLRELGLLSLFLVLLAGIFTLTALQFLVFRVNDETEARLRTLGDKLSSNIHDDLFKMRKQLLEWCEVREGDGDDRSKVAVLAADLKKAEISEVIRDVRKPWADQLNGVTPNPSTFPFINNAFWTDDDGHQIVKWSVSGYVTPLISIAKQALYTSPKRIYLDGAGPPFYFGSVLPPNKLEYLAALSMATEDCNAHLNDTTINGSAIRGDVTGGTATIVGQPFSLIDPILPFGYGFALVDETGKVLFHSDKTRNGRENFREESDWSKELYAGIFGHSTDHALRINYMGKDSLALVTPIQGVTDAPWALVVYADLSGPRTLALQTMTMSATLMLLILAGPALVALIWCLVRRPRFAPAWLWPDRRRMSSYIYQIAVYVLLILLFLIVGFRGPVEQIVVACAAVPYSALLLTFWCYRRYPWAMEPWHGRTGRSSGFAAASLSIIAAVLFLSILALHWSRTKALVSLLLVVGIAIVPLLDGPCRHIAAVARQRRRTESKQERSDGGSTVHFTYLHGYALSVMLLMLLIGVLMPIALFRGCLAVEARLAVKQAQLHVASALKERRATILEKCEAHEIGYAPCEQFTTKDAPVWRQIVLNPSSLPDTQLAIAAHDQASGAELYEDWFRDLVYRLHHDYNPAAAEMLGVIPDRLPLKPDSILPDWSWTNSESTVTLRLHGVRPDGDSEETEGDLLITSALPQPLGNTGLGPLGIAAGVMVIIGGVLWLLMRRVFLVQVAPLKMTGARELAEALRQMRSVLVLAPPVLDVGLDDAAVTLDLALLAREPGWAEALDLRALPRRGVIEVRHFEHTSDTATKEQKLAFLERLTRESAQVAAIVQTSPSGDDYRGMFPRLSVIDLREEPFLWLKKCDGPARDMIWAECCPISPLWPLGVQLARDLGSETAYSEDTVASEILERADPYYRLVWSEFSEEQKFVLSQLAEDGLLNPSNGRAIRQLMRRGFIVQDPQFRIMNESFRRFLQSVVNDEMKQRWLDESRRSGWGRVHGAFVMTMIVLGAFLLTTQNALWQSSAAYVTTAFGALGTLSKLFNTYRGNINAEKAG